MSDEEAIDDVQFTAFLREATDCTEAECDELFDMFDVDASGQIEFDEFFLLVCMLIALKDREEKQFLYYHSRTCFELIDADGSQQISTAEFARFGGLFNISKFTINQIFSDFDVSGDKELDYDEFRLFTIAAIDKQRALDAKKTPSPEKPLGDPREGALAASLDRANSLLRSRSTASFRKTTQLIRAGGSPIREDDAERGKAGADSPARSVALIKAPSKCIIS